MNKFAVLFLMVFALPTLGSAPAVSGVSALPEQLPPDLVWETNLDDPIYASPNAVRGGMYRGFLGSFPLTLRRVGPDSNSGISPYLRGLALGTTGLHPNTLRPIPHLATHWAYGSDGVSIYFKLDPGARWSDGPPVTADDYLFTLEFMRSPYIVGPWYKDHYTNVILDVKKYGSHIIGVLGSAPKTPAEMHYLYGLQPVPRHFHKLDENWVRDYNWKIEPVTGPYHITDIRKGKYIEFRRIDDWWGDNKRYFKYRFNMDRVLLKVVRTANTAWQYFTKGELESFGLVLPQLWHKKARGEIFDNNYVVRYKFYNDVPRPAFGIYLNEDDPILADKRVRYAIAHAMNIELVLEKILRNDYERLQTMHEGFGDYSNTSIKARPFDLSKANTYLDEAGWRERGGDGIRLKDGERLSLRVTYAQPHHTVRLVVLQEEARKAGIELRLQLLDGATAFKQVHQKRHQLAWFGWAGGGMSPVFWEFFHSDQAHIPQTNNITNTDNPEMDRLIDRYRASTSEAERKILAITLEQMVHDQGSLIPTFKIPYIRGAYWRWVKLPPAHGTRSSDVLFEPMPYSFGGGEGGPDIGGLFWYDAAEKQRTLDARDRGIKLDNMDWVDETWRVN